jgi:hypothetical protein
MPSWFRFFCLLSISMLLFCAKPAVAQEAAAKQAAEDVLRSLADGQFKTVWDQKVSKVFKDRTSENLFLANMSIGRPQLGKLLSLTSVSVEYAKEDPQTGYKGDIYAVTFRSKYTVGEFFERIVVVMDVDGKYKLAGIFGSPVPRN